MRGAKPCVILNGVYFREGGKWVGECEELGTATFADTLEDVQAELREITLMHLNGLEQFGQREEFFRVHRIKMYADDEIPTKVMRRVNVDTEGTAIRIGPLPFAVHVGESNTAG